MVASMNRPAIAFVSALTILSCASAASAQTPSAAEVSLARDEFRAGVAAAQATQWAEALRAFTRSYQLFPRPLTLLNLAGAQAATNHLVSAAESYRMFLRQAAGPSEAPHRAASEQQLAAIERRIPRARIAIENLVPEDSLALDGLPLSQIVLASAFPMDPGHHVLVVSRNARKSAAPSSMSASGPRARLLSESQCVLRPSRILLRPAPPRRRRA